jgi:hypothetical protein
LEEGGDGAADDAEVGERVAIVDGQIGGVPRGDCAGAIGKAERLGAVERRRAQGFGRGQAGAALAEGEVEQGELEPDHGGGAGERSAVVADGEPSAGGGDGADVVHAVGDDAGEVVEDPSHLEQAEQLRLSGLGALLAAERRVVQLGQPEAADEGGEAGVAEVGEPPKAGRFAGGGVGA